MWSGERYSATEQGSWASYHRLPARSLNSFSLEKGFEETLNDPGPYFQLSGRPSVSLSDIYVFPRLRKVSLGEENREFVDADQLLRRESIRDGVIVEGEERSGRTSLLYMLYRHYHDRGLIPLLIRGRDISGKGKASMRAAVTKAVERQYGEGKVEAFAQLPKERRVLLVDDFDLGSLRSSAVRAEVLCDVRRRFGHFVVAVSEMFEVRELIDGSASKELKGVSHLRLQPFGYVLRGKLITKWAQLTANPESTSSEILFRRDQIDRVVTEVMSRNIVPSGPLYLLTLLQSVSAGRSGDFRESALGYYYQYLLTEGFQCAGVKPEKLTELFQYCTQLAWFFHRSKVEELSEQDLRDFNEEFSATWHGVPFDDRLQLLVRARVLKERSGQFSFRYPYIYFFLKGKYLAEHLGDLEIRSYITRCCRHLYVRDNANTVLFLVHHTNDEFVLNAISDALATLFSGRQPISFQGDTSAISALIKEAPKWVHTGETPERLREKRDELRDRESAMGDGLTDVEELSESLSLPAQIGTLFKNVQILGQVLKNQYSRIKKPEKAALLRQLFNGPLRALSDFLDFVGKHPAALISFIEMELAKRSAVQDETRRKEIARKVVANITQMVTLAFLIRAADSVSSLDLLEDIRATVKNERTLAFRMIELSVLLDAPKALPKKVLRELYQDSKGNLIAERLVYLIVLRRLYMYRTSEKDMQWLYDELKVDLGHQHKITYKQKDKELEG